MEVHFLDQHNRPLPLPPPAAEEMQSDWESLVCIRVDLPRSERREALELRCIFNSASAFAMLAVFVAEENELDLVFDEAKVPFSHGISPRDSTLEYFGGGVREEFVLVRCASCALRVWLL